LNGEYVDAERMCLFDYQWKKIKVQLNEYVGFESPDELPQRTRAKYPENQDVRLAF